MEEPTIIFYGRKDHSPVKKSLDDLDSNNRAKLLKTINYIKNYGINSVPKYTKNSPGLPSVNTIKKIAKALDAKLEIKISYGSVLNRIYLLPDSTY